MKLSPARVRFVIAAFLLISGAVFMAPYGDFSRNGAVWQFQVAALTMAAGWLTALRVAKVGAPTFWAVAIALRLILLPMQPGADVHRYIWEGRTQTHGFSPYRHPPDSEVLRPLRDANWELVQFKETTAIYPPLAELCFRLLASTSEKVLFFKLAFVAGDLAVCFLLATRFGFARSLLYAWNPLVVYSFAGGAHFDSWFILCLTGGWLLWEEKKVSSAILLIATATAIKWIALPLVAWSIFQTIRKSGQLRAAILAASAAFLVFAIPWLIVTGGNIHAPLFPKEFAQHARSFGLLPTILSRLWPSRYFENKIFLVPLVIVILVLMRSRAVMLLCERWVAVLLALSPMVHAWYFTWLMPFAVATRNAGSIAVAISAFAYFGISALPGVPKNGWPALFVQMVVIWLPFLGGFAWSESDRVTCGQEQLAGSREYGKEWRLTRLR